MAANRQLRFCCIALMLGVAACSNDANPSNDTFARLVRPKIKTDDEQWCLNPVKLKYASNNEMVSFPQPAVDETSAAPAPQASQPDADSQQENVATPDTAPTPAPADPQPPTRGFPLIFAEEAFVPWRDQDVFVMDLLIGGGYIAVHSGGYPQSARNPGQPGDAYAPTNQDQVSGVVDEIKSRGAVVDLTPKGRDAGVWDADNGFCVTGNWEFDSVENFTTPAPDQTGTVVTHIKSLRDFNPKALGKLTGGFNPMGFTFQNEQTFDAAKFNDGWQLNDTGDGKGD